MRLGREKYLEGRVVKEAQRARLKARKGAYNTAPKLAELRECRVNFVARIVMHLRFAAVNELHSDRELPGGPAESSG